MFVNVVLVFVPTVRTATKQTMMTSASMTAYSTAVGPSADRTRFKTSFLGRFMAVGSQSRIVWGVQLIKDMSQKGAQEPTLATNRAGKQ